MENIDSFLLSNPHVKNNKQIQRKLEKSISLIMDVYQWAGKKDFEEEKTIK
jgi:hypothetical protein